MNNMIQIKTDPETWGYCKWHEIGSHDIWFDGQTIYANRIRQVYEAPGWSDDGLRRTGGIIRIVNEAGEPIPASAFSKEALKAIRREWRDYQAALDDERKAFEKKAAKVTQ